MKSSSRRSVALEVPPVETPQESLVRLRLEVEELRASRARILRAADADRRTLERELHDGPQQRLVALAVNLELTRRLADDDPPAAKALLDEMGHDVQRALDETRRLAERIYPPLLEAGGLAAALRAAAATLGVRAHVEVAAGAPYPAEIAGLVYFCCLEVLERAGEGARATIAVRDEEEALVFDVGAGVVDSAAGLDAGLQRVRDRIEALGGQLSLRSDPTDGTRVSGSLPLSR